MSFKRSIRNYHRYLGLIIGIQFLFWTLGGLYFSWTSIDEIRGSNLKNQHTFFSKNLHIPDINPYLDSLNNIKSIDSIKEIEIRKIDDKPFIVLTYFSSDNEMSVERNILIDIEKNELLDTISAELAGRLAQKSMKNAVGIKKIDRIDEKDINNHHEYRGGIFPAYAVHLVTNGNLVIYVDASNGEVLSYRSDKWRIFDFLWMMHTMDYANRDNFNNWVLRIFAVLGLLTLFSGFILFFSTGKWFRKKKSN